jgi:hypothetical protein
MKGLSSPASPLNTRGPGRSRRSACVRVAGFFAVGFRTVYRLEVFFVATDIASPVYMSSNHEPTASSRPSFTLSATSHCARAHWHADSDIYLVFISHHRLPVEIAPANESISVDVPCHFAFEVAASEEPFHAPVLQRVVTDDGDSTADLDVASPLLPVRVPAVPVRR